MSSVDVIKSVSKELKYYFQVKRLEEGFDLSTSDCPKLDHPPTKARPIVNYAGRHDRSLKHYFSKPHVKVALTQFKAPEAKKSREQQVRRAVKRNLKKYQFVTPPFGGFYYGPPARKGSAAQVQQSLGVRGPDKKAAKGASRTGYPVLRSAPPRQISKGEAQRLINIATKLLVATETIDLKESGGRGGGGKRRAASAKERSSAPTSLPPVHSRGGSGRRGRHGRRVRSAQMRSGRYRDPDSAYDSPNDSSSSPTSGDQVPAWLRKQMEKVDLHDDDERGENQWVRPHSPGREVHYGRMAYSTAPEPRHVAQCSTDPERRRRSSASGSSSEGDGGGSRPSSRGSGARSGGDEDGSRRGSGSRSAPSPPKPTPREDAQIQTGGELLKKYDPMDQIAPDGETSPYRVHVWTGNRLGASTRAQVRLVLFGDRGRTREILLQNSRKYKIKFQKGQEDVFDVDEVRVGPIRKIAIGHDKQETSYGWYVEKVQVKDRGSGMQYLIQCDRWLSSREGDRRTFKEFQVTESMTYSPGPEGEQEDFTPAARMAVDRPQIRYEAAADWMPDDGDQRSVQGKTDSSSRTSVVNNYGDRSPDDSLIGVIIG